MKWYHNSYILCHIITYFMSSYVLCHIIAVHGIIMIHDSASYYILHNMDRVAISSHIFPQCVV